MSIATNAIRSIFSAVGLEISRKRPRINIVEPQRKDYAPSNDEPSTRFKMYHLGCGSVLADDFLNVDGDFEGLNLKNGVCYAVGGRPSTHILQHDLRNGIPAANNSLEMIYHSHFYEHLSDLEGISFLSECYRCLTPGGLMRFAVPDLKLWCTNYLSQKNEFFDWYREAYLENNKVRYRTNAAVFMGMLYNWGHKMAYDYESLLALLSDAGFTNVRRAEWGLSEKIPSILSVEGPTSPRRLESLVIECNKGGAGSQPAVSS
jgi:predicted SAM-dependent methyltransferase